MDNQSVKQKTSLFCADKDFYAQFFSMMGFLVLQNVITYSVNVADTVMLGSFSQTSLSAAAAVNQIQYILQQFTIMGLGEGMVILAGQYIGHNKLKETQKLYGMALAIGAAVGVLLTLALSIFPGQAVALFTKDPNIIEEGRSYIEIIRFTYLPFIISNLLLASLRSQKAVSIAFKTAIVTLVLNVCINYSLIFGHFGLPRMGIRGAAVGTITARLVEFAIIIYYCMKGHFPFFKGHHDGGKSFLIEYDIKSMFVYDASIMKSYIKVSVPCVVAGVLFSASVAIQTAIFGHISSDALAASSAAGTLFQYMKMVPIGAASASSVLISQSISRGVTPELKQKVHSLQLIFLCTGIIMGLMLLIISGPVLSFYSLTEQAAVYVKQMILIQAVIIVGTGYQMPCQVGIIRAGGDAMFTLATDLIYSWVIVIPLGLIAAFVLHQPVGVVTWCLNIDQLLKCVTNTIKVYRYTWIKKLV